jgi:hypothetical protein
MNKSIFPIIILALFSGAWRVTGQDPQFPEKDRKITAVYNERIDTTVVRFGPMHLVNFKTGSPFSYAIEDGELRLSAFFTYKGKTFVKPESIALIFLSVNVPTNRWELSTRKDMEIMADDAHWSIPTVHVVESKNSGNLVIESLGVSIPCESFAKIANSKKIKLRLGDRKFDLAKEHSATLRDLAGRAGC